MDALFHHHNVSLTIMAIDFVASMIAADDPRLAARLHGAATRWRNLMGGGMKPESSGLPSVAATATERLGAQAFRAEFDAGTRLELQNAIQLARNLRICQEEIPC